MSEESSTQALVPCKQCNGTKIRVSKGFTSLEGVVYPERTDKCYSCGGEGFFPIVDEKKILERIVAKQGKNKGKIRAAMSSPNGHNVDEGRAYFVWRIARFHGGKDVTMPMTADMVVRGDPFKKELEAIADKVAKSFFGTDLAGAARWAKAFGII